MTNDSASLQALVPAEVLGDLMHNWGWLLAQGILLVVLGTIGLGMTLWLTLATVFIFGVFLVIGGVVQLFQAFKCRGWQSILWHVIIGILYVLAGVIIFGNPLMASTMLTLLLGGVLIGIGIVRIVMALQHRVLKNWIWPLIGGIAAIILGFMILAQWPVSGFWVIGLFVAIEMIFSGWSSIIIALGAREISKQHAPAA
ncbi:MAG: HdeD family acid-resistance protein [Desulfobaccales bacterium]